MEEEIISNFTFTSTTDRESTKGLAPMDVSALYPNDRAMLQSDFTVQKPRS